MIEFHSNFIYLKKIEEPEEHTIYVGFADNQFDTEESLLFQKSLSPNEEDKDLGLDKIYITYIDQFHSAYGEVKKVCLKKEYIYLLLEENTSKKMKVDNEFRIIFSKDVNFEELKVYLEELFQFEKTSLEFF